MKSVIVLNKYWLSLASSWLLTGLVVFLRNGSILPTLRKESVQKQMTLAQHMVSIFRNLGTLRTNAPASIVCSESHWKCVQCGWKMSDVVRRCSFSLVPYSLEEKFCANLYISSCFYALNHLNTLQSVTSIS